MGNLAHKVHGGLQLIAVCRDWPKWLGEYFSGADDGRPESYRMRCGVTLHTRRNKSDLHMIDENWCFRKYEYFGYDVKPGDVVVDIGGNIGSFAVHAAAVRKAGRVIVFEPHPVNFGLLERNVDSNGLGRVITCVNEAVSGTGGSALLFEDAANPGGHSLSGVSTAASRSVEVRCTTLAEVLDRYGLDRVNYLKIDCEGAEYEILEETPDEVLARVDRVSMEYHEREGRRVEELGERLQGVGFQVRYFDGHRIYAGRGA